MEFEKREDKKLKFEGLKWLRLKQRCAFIATEVGAHSADILGINEKRMVELEVKITLSDLKNDFKKHKHYVYRKEDYSSWQLQWVPTHFYYLVPKELVAQAKQFLDTYKCEKYGIIQAEDMTVIKRAAWLHKREINSHVKFVVALRMGSELLRFHEAWI